MLLTQWASKAGEPAAKALLESSPNDAFLKDTYPRVMQSWANNSPLEAGRWYVDPANTQDRSSKSLDAGRSFTAKVFRQMQLAKPDTTISELEKLRNTTEIIGAVEGIRDAGKKLHGDPAKVSKDLERVKNKADVIHATDHYLKAKDAADDAAATIKDPKQRIEFSKALESK